METLISRPELTPAIAAGLLAVGIMEIAKPNAFVDIGIYFKRACRDLAPEMQLRLWRALQARTQAERTSLRDIRLVGVYTLLMAGAVFVPQVPVELPYAAACFAMGAALLLTYLQLQRSTRRAAALIPRKTLAELAPGTFATAIVALICVGAVAMVPAYRLTAILIGASMTAILWTAWRVAESPAFMPGDDAEVEYAVDHRVRVSRANWLCVLASAPLYLLFAFMPTAASNSHAFVWVHLAAMVAFLTALSFNLSVQYKRLAIV